MSYHQDLKIDRYNLEWELVHQPQLYMEWALKAATASVEKEDSKTDLELTKAKVDEKIRNDPQKYGIPEGKSTDRAIKLAVEKHPKVRKYFKFYLKALKNEKVLNRAEKAFGQRKKMLEALVTLNIQLHFAEPKIPVTQQEQMYENTRRNVLNKMKGKRIRRRG
jgi:hypothetical protein